MKPNHGCQWITDYRRAFIAGGSYFFAVNLADRRTVDTEHVSALRAAFRCVHERHPFTIESFVVLSDHLHAFWTLPDGDTVFSSSSPADQGDVLAQFAEGCARLTKPPTQR